MTLADCRKRRKNIPYWCGMDNGQNGGGANGGTPPLPPCGDNDDASALTFPSYRIALVHLNDPNAANNREVGDNFIQSGTPQWASGDANNPVNLEFHPSTTPGTAEGYVASAANWLAGQNVLLNGWVRARSAAGARYFVGMTSNTLVAQVASAAPTGDYFGFRYDPAVDTNWRAIVTNTTPASLTQDTTVLPGTNGQMLRCWQESGSCHFCINGTKVAEIALVPDATSMLRLVAGMDLLDTSERFVGLSLIHI